MSGIGVLHNPHTGRNKKQKNLKIFNKLKTILGDNGLIYETSNPDELGGVMQTFKDADIDILAINGGDGTIHLALTELISIYKDRRLPKIVSLRGGTMNTFSNSIKIKGSTLKILKKVVKQYKNQSPFLEMKQHLLKVNGKYGVMSGACAIAKFLDCYYKSEHPGPMHAANMVTRLVAGSVVKTEFSKIFAPVPLRIKVDGQTLVQEQFSVILICTIRELGLGFTPTPHAYSKPGHFHLMASSMNGFEYGLNVPTLYMGRDISHPKMHYNQAAARVEVEPMEALRWMVDGEIYTTTESLSYSVGPKITVLFP